MKVGRTSSFPFPFVTLTCKIRRNLSPVVDFIDFNRELQIYLYSLNINWMNININFILNLNILAATIWQIS